MYTILDITRVYVQYVQHIVQTSIGSHYCFQKLYKNLRGGIITTESHDSPLYPSLGVLFSNNF